MPYCQPAARPTLVALHGLEGSSDAHYMKGLADKAFIESRCEGFEEFRENLKQYDVEDAARYCGVSADDRTALRLAALLLLFLAALFVAPAVGVIPAAATAPALIIVGALVGSSGRPLRSCAASRSASVRFATTNSTTSGRKASAAA